MSQRLQPSTDVPVLTASDAERQLEGRARLITAAVRPHAELEELLSGRRWRRALLKQPERVPALVAQAEALKEALERVHRRAASEAWEESTPVWREARELSQRRERLTALARRRLEALAEAPPNLPLEEVLTRLDARVRQSANWELTPGEVLAFETDARWHPGRRLVRGLIPHPTRRHSVVPYFVLVGVGVLGALLMGAHPLSLEDVAPALFMSVTFGLMAAILGSVLWPLLRSLVWPLLGSGQVRITSERLLWKPAFGAPQAVRLGTIPDGGITVDDFSLDLRVKGDRQMHARAVLDAMEVAALLELHRQPPLRGAARRGVRLERVAILSATLEERGQEARQGHCVLHPGGVSFIPEQQGPKALQAITGKSTSLEAFHADGVLEALRWLPRAEFDACVASVVKATGGTFWDARSARHVPGTSASKEVRIESGGSVLKGQWAWAQAAAVEAVLRDWSSGARFPRLRGPFRQRQK
ncbi:hypothetical protein D7Y13_22330 [Corallococcus praedator]|uniref:Uncharacterized protein n=1 Tax=Corallococcus praedator TaxID=2316724 RepID=A0ABX9QE44_9BACT|nr:MULTISPECIES: hypothetical protein [Corallococcus]RKH26006.1 hypothetical protein D7X75_29065 [Corallococcus sp. CA031C]RKI03329.1 hypothetical protein D7Y13_22330 [Corallococcus praedator]